MGMDWIHHRPLSNRDRTWRWVSLASAIAPLIGAFLYNQGLRLTPGRCLFQATFGFPAPSCGLTRSFMAIARGDWSMAFTYHFYGPILFAGLLLTTVHLGLELGTHQAWSAPYTRATRNIWVIGSMVALFFAYYALRLYARYHSADIPTPLADTALWQFLTNGASLL